MYEKIFLISGLSPFIKEQVSPQIGLGYLAEVLQKEGIASTAFDFAVNRSIKALLKNIEMFKPDLIGVHMMSHGYSKQFAAIKLIKEQNPDVHVIVGGPHASIARSDMLKNNCSIDFAAFLEGEETLLSVAKGLPLKDVKGLVYRDNGKIIENEERPFIKNLDGIPFPKYDSFNLGSYPTNIMSIATSRGCPYRCIYCPVKAAIGCQFRARSPENVFEKIKYWYDKGYKEIWIQDDNFTLLPKRVDSLLEILLKAELKGLRLALPNGIRSDRVDRELLSKMKKAGFFHIAFGVEAGNNKILENIKKGEKIEDMTKAIESALDVGIKVSLFFLLGSPGETESDIDESFAIAKKYNVSQALFYNIVPFPKTELFESLKRNDLLLCEPEYYLNEIDHYSDEPIFVTPELGREQRRMLLKKGRLISREIRAKYIKTLLPRFLKLLPKSLYPLLDGLYSLKRRLDRYI